MLSPVSGRGYFGKKFPKWASLECFFEIRVNSAKNSFFREDYSTTETRERERRREGEVGSGMMTQSVDLAIINPTSFFTLSAKTSSSRVRAFSVRCSVPLSSDGGALGKT